MKKQQGRTWWMKQIWIITNRDEIGNRTNPQSHSEINTCTVEAERRNKLACLYSVFCLFIHHRSYAKNKKQSTKKITYMRFSNNWSLQTHLIEISTCWSVAQSPRESCLARTLGPIVLRICQLWVNDSLRFRYDFPISLRFRYDFVTISLRFQSVSSDQVLPIIFLPFYILRAKSGRMKRIRKEISAARYDSLQFVTILEFRYEFVTIPIRFIPPTLSLKI